jgi:class III poly(R)-hydroxyalkanoic acid synthase PhaE subunit
VHWTEQNEMMVNAFAETQKQMWKSWFDWMPGSSPTPLSWGVTDQAYDAAVEGIKTWSVEGQQVAKAVADRLLASQGKMQHFVEMSLRAWNAITPKIDSGEDWHTAVGNYTETLRRQLLQFSQEMQKAFQDTDALSRLYREEWKGLVQPWTESLRRAPWNFGQASTGNDSGLMELQKLYWDAYEKTFGRMLESPTLGLTREINEDILKGMDAWVDYRRASFEYQVALGETWVRAFEEFLQQNVALTEKSETVPNVKTLLLLWIEVVDRIFTDVFRSEEYIRIQGNVVNTGNAYRLRERDIIDAFLKGSHIASRSELDEAYRRIYDIRKDVKELKKARHEAQTELAEAKALKAELRLGLKEIQNERRVQAKKKIQTKKKSK